jgi:D-glycero-alpha-D-manno-heptose-7-phosphate kinase
MIITRTPFRISLFGGGTDFPDWYKINNGAVISTSINRYCYISCRKLPNFHDCKHRIVYSIIENVKELDDIKHPSVREVTKWSGIEYGLEIHHDGDLPARSGLGSSSSFTVGLINALMALQEKRISKNKLAKEAIHIEQNIIKENVGSQDQIAAAYGGFNLIEFKKNDTFDVKPIIASQQRQNFLNDHLMLFYTGVSRISSEIAYETIQNLNKKEKIFFKLYDLLWEGLNVIESKTEDIKDIGRLLHESWLYKKEISNQISTNFIDDIYKKAMENGALGGKILGSGGGGFILFFVPIEKKELIKKLFINLTHVPFEFENSGSKVVVYEPNGL